MTARDRPLPPALGRSAAFYRRRFESSVFGNHQVSNRRPMVRGRDAFATEEYHCSSCCINSSGTLTYRVPLLALQMMPPPELALAMKHPEDPPKHPCGPNTSFQYKTPMPHTFTESSLPKHNGAKTTFQREEHPIYQATSTEIGRLPLQETDLHMRWYGLQGEFTNGWAAALPKTRVNTGLNTGMDRSNVHPIMDQGWSGHLGLTDFGMCPRSEMRARSQRRGGPRTTDRSPHHSPRPLQPYPTDSTPSRS